MLASIQASASAVLCWQWGAPGGARLQRCATLANRAAMVALFASGQCWRTVESGVRLLSPKGGETFDIGDTISIEVLVDTAVIKDARGMDWFVALLSVDGRQSWSVLANVHGVYGPLVFFVALRPFVLDTFSTRDSSSGMYVLAFSIQAPASIEPPPYDASTVSDSAFIGFRETLGRPDLVTSNEIPFSIRQGTAQVASPLHRRRSEESCAHGSFSDTIATNLRGRVCRPARRGGGRPVAGVCLVKKTRSETENHRLRKLVF